MMNDENKREGEEEVPRQRYAFPPFLLPSVLFYFSPPSLPPSLWCSWAPALLVLLLPVSRKEKEKTAQKAHKAYN